MAHMVYRCIGGAPADDGGVCTEHGETACVIGVPVPLTDSADPDGARPDVTAPDPVPEASTARPKRG